MLAEYSAIGTIFNLYVASVAFPIIIVVGVLTTAYTVYGGLIVSVYTDQIQGGWVVLWVGYMVGGWDCLS